MIMWQYKVVDVTHALLDFKMEELLNRYGAEGWEFVTLHHNGGAYQLFFKKKV